MQKKLCMDFHKSKHLRKCAGNAMNQNRQEILSSMIYHWRRSKIYGMILHLSNATVTRLNTRLWSHPLTQCHIIIFIKPFNWQPDQLDCKLQHPHPFSLSLSHKQQVAPFFNLCHQTFNNVGDPAAISSTSVTKHPISHHITGLALTIQFTLKFGFHDWKTTCKIRRRWRIVRLIVAQNWTMKIENLTKDSDMVSNHEIDASYESKWQGKSSSIGWKDD